MTHTEEQEWEREWWGNCLNTYAEETKQIAYASRMGLVARPEGGQWPVFDVGGRNIVDIGGGPVSLLLKTTNRGERCVVVDPCQYPWWVSHRYAAGGIGHLKIQGEKLHAFLSDDASFDEAWIYNVLQHTEDPEQVIANARNVARLIRIFEWIETPVTPGHPHTLTEPNLRQWLGSPGTVDFVNEGGAVGPAFYGVFGS